MCIYFPLFSLHLISLRLNGNEINWLRSNEWTNERTPPQTYAQSFPCSTKNKFANKNKTEHQRSRLFIISRVWTKVYATYSSITILGRWCSGDPAPVYPKKMKQKFTVTSEMMLLFLTSLFLSMFQHLGAITHHMVHRTILNIQNTNNLLTDASADKISYWNNRNYFEIINVHISPISSNIQFGHLPCGR